MRRRLTLALMSLTLIFALATHTPHAHAQTNAQTDKDAQLAAKIRSAVNSHGIGARVSVKLRDKKKLAGDIKDIGDQDFIITLAETNTTQTIAYTDALQVKHQNDKGMSKGAKIAIITVGTLFILSLIGNRGFGG